MESAGDGTRWVPDVYGTVGVYGGGSGSSCWDRRLFWLAEQHLPGTQHMLVDGLCCCASHHLCIVLAPAPPCSCRAPNGTLLLNVCHCTRPAAVR